MTRKKTHEEFVADVRKLTADEYTVIGKYTLSRNKLKMKHNRCGHEWMIKPNNFLQGKRCPECVVIKTTNDFKKEVSEISNGNLILLSEYVDCDSPVTVLCKTHAYEFQSTPTKVLRKRMVCKKCKADYMSTTQRKSPEDFYSELWSRHKGNIIAEGEYINTHTKTKFKCLSCNNEFMSEPNSVLRISGCPYCSVSKGEEDIRSYLLLNNIEFTPQKIFEDCKYVRSLLFDFYIPSHNLLIEYNGKQHYEPIEYFGGEKAFQNQLERDAIKRSYAHDNNIELVCIPYTITGNNIGKILDNYLRSGKPEHRLK